MVTLLDLMRGSQALLPDTLKKGIASDILPTGIHIVPLEGVKSKVFASTVRGTQGDLYHTNITFLSLDPLPISKLIPSISKDRVIVRCSCPAYYFYNIAANIKAKANVGSQFKPYVRKTAPPSWGGRPYKNPNDIPACCKHIVSLTNHLTNLGKIKS